MTIQLISLTLCPFVQRSVITLLEKGMAYEMTYLSMDELKNPPQWFREISPFGKVPVLRTGDTTLFESVVIMEYIDEISPPSLHPADPLQKALNRAWMSFGEELLLNQFRYATAADKQAYESARQQLEDNLQRLEGVIAGTPFFNGADFQLVDAAYAPFFMRLDIIEKHHTATGLYDNKPKVSAWAEALRSRDSVKNSVIPDLATQYIDYVRNTSEYARSVYSTNTDAND